MRETKIQSFGVNRFDGFERGAAKSRTPSRMNHAHNTGSNVNVTINEPTSANTIVSAIGLNSVPEGPART